MKKTLILCIVIFPLLAGCAGRPKYTLVPIKTFDPDNVEIVEPKQVDEYQYWDIFDSTVVYQIEKALDLNWTLRKIGNTLSLTRARQADNINVLDETTNSSWYTHRHYHHHMTIEELQKGPNITDGPDPQGPWIVLKDKSTGQSPGFWIKDPKGDIYILKFDLPNLHELSSSAEVIATKILYASGYYVPQNTIAYFDPKILKVGEGVTIFGRIGRRPMTSYDIEFILRNVPRQEDGTMRCLASKFVDGRPMGMWMYRGKRRDDPNDLVSHEHRRELRGLKVISSWLNDVDRRAGNTLAVVVEEEGKRYIKHYIIDMGSTLGSKRLSFFYPKYGNEYLVDPRTVGLSFIAFGSYLKPWESETDHLSLKYPSIGYFENKYFNPGKWYPSHSNPAFEYATLRDSFWGAKIVTSFTDDDIRAMVKTAKLTNPLAEEYLTTRLIERRDMIGRYWFERINPLDRFKIETTPEDSVVLTFNDLAVDGKLESQENSKYIYQFFHRRKKLSSKQSSSTPSITLSKAGKGILDTKLTKEHTFKEEKDKIFSVRINTIRSNTSTSKTTEVFFYYPGVSDHPRIVGIQREE